MLNLVHLAKTSGHIETNPHRPWNCGSSELSKKDCIVDQCQLPAAKKTWAVGMLACAVSQGVTRVEQVDFIRSVQIQIWLCARRTQHRKDGVHSQARWEEGSTKG